MPGQPAAVWSTTQPASETSAFGVSGAPACGESMKPMSVFGPDASAAGVQSDGASATAGETGWSALVRARATAHAPGLQLRNATWPAILSESAGRDDAEVPAPTVTRADGSS